jgi:hypothetical protein
VWFADLSLSLKVGDMSKRAIFNRIMLACAVMVGVLVVSLIVREEVASRVTSIRLHNRIAYWTSVLNSAVAVGEPRSQAQQWLRKTFPNQPAGTEQHLLVASAETIDVVGTHFPCAAWVIIIDIQLGPNDRVTSREVKDSGICL